MQIQSHRDFGVPDLTFCASIKLNERVSLHIYRKQLRYKKGIINFSLSVVWSKREKPKTKKNQDFEKNQDFDWTTQETPT